MSDDEIFGVIFILIICYAVQGIIFGILSRKINQNKGYYGGFAYGFFLGLIGLLYVACRPDNKKSFNYDWLSKDNTQTGNAQTLKEGGWRCSQCNNLNSNQFMVCTACGKQKDGVWKCTQCNNINPNHLTTCTCGKRKDGNYKEAVSSKQNTYDLSGLNPKTKQCPNCGKQYDDDNKFCFSCGSKLIDTRTGSNVYVQNIPEPKTKQCPNCGKQYDDDNKFCFSCGSKLIDTVRNAAVQENQGVSSVPPVSPAPATAAMSATMQCPKCRLLFKNKEKCPVCGNELVKKD